MEKMFHFFDHIYNDFTSKDKYVFGFSSFIGWVFGINLFFTWGPVLSAMMSITIASVTALAGAITVDFYKLKIKNKLFKKPKNVKEEKTAA